MKANIDYIKPEWISPDMVGDRKITKVSVRPMCEIRTQEFIAADFYYACNNGYIIGFNGDFLQQQLEGDYLQVTICDGFGGSKTIDTHRVIALAFCYKTKDRNHVHHINEVKTDNRSRNLIWVTTQEHRLLHSLLNSGKTEEYKAMISRIKKGNSTKGQIR